MALHCGSAPADNLNSGQPRKEQTISDSPVPELTIRKDVIQLVVPQDSPNVFRPQVSTRRQGLEATTAFFRVRGDLHRRDSYPTNMVQLMSGFTRQFFPLADALIECLLGKGIRANAPVVLVNSQHLSHC